MKASVAAVLLIATQFGAALSFAAAEPLDCARVQFSEARSLVNLPPEVNILLGKDLSGLAGIADRGGKYNPTDVVDSTLPMRRFALAAISSRLVLVAIERGGYAHFFELWSFEQRADGWHAEQRSTVQTLPRSLQELVAGACK